MTGREWEIFNEILRLTKSLKESQQCPINENEDFSRGFYQAQRWPIEQAKRILEELNKISDNIETLQNPLLRMESQNPNLNPRNG